MNSYRLIKAALFSVIILGTATAHAIDVQSTAKALRLANTITGGLMPSSDPLFAQMVTKVAAGDVEGAAALASNSKYFANYLARRLALQMQSPLLDASTSKDNDATTFLIAHFVGGAGKSPSLSTIWSENATYTVNVAGTPTHAAAIPANQVPSIDWTNLARADGQSALDNVSGAQAPIPAKHVGGYTTLSDRDQDSSFAMWAASAGTNLRFIEGIWEISTGFELMDVASVDGMAQNVPRFVPEYDPNFFHGQGQPACIACHGGGMSSLNHGYSTVADTFDFVSGSGFTYISTPSTGTRKSLGSDKNKRNTNSTCNLVNNPTAVCNPDSAGADPNQGWNVADTWQSSGVLGKMGWKGATSGQGLNELGAAIGQSTIVYENFTRRVVNEVCPMGIFNAAKISQIAALANPNATPPGTDDIRTIVNKVAVDGSCL